MAFKRKSFGATAMSREEELERSKKEFASKKAAPALKTVKKADQPIVKSDIAGKLGAVSGFIGSGSAGQAGGIGDVASGAAAGAQFGGAPGAIAGAGLGLLKARQKTKRFNQDLQANVFREQGKIAQDTASESNRAIKNIMDGFRLALLS